MNYLKHWKKKVTKFTLNFNLPKQENEPNYLLALFNEKELINKVFLFQNPKQAQEFIKENDEYMGWIAYLIDLKNDTENRSYIKLT